LDEDRALRVQLNHLEAAARGWNSSGRPDSELYRGGRLEAAAELARSRHDDLGELEQAFVWASTASALQAEARDRAQRRRLRRALVGTGVALVFALVAAALAVAARDDADERAEDADLASLVSTSQSLVSSKRDVAALLAVAASEREPGPESDNALLHAVYSDPSLLANIRPRAPGRDVHVPPDGRSLYINPMEAGEPIVRYDVATHDLVDLELGQGDRAPSPFVPLDDSHVALSYGTEDGDGDPDEPLLRVVDTETGEAEATAELAAPPHHLALSPDGQRLVVTTLGLDAPAVVEAFAVPSLLPIGSVTQPGPPSDLPWASESAWIDDDHVAVGSPSGRLLVWQPSTGEIVQRLNDPPSASTASALRVTEDGSTLVAVGNRGEGMAAFDLRTGLPAWAQPRSANPTFDIDERHGVIWAQEPGFGSSKAIALDLRTGEPTGAVRDGQHGGLCDLVVGDDDRLLMLASCNENSVSMWSLDGGTATAPGVADVGHATGAGNWTQDGAVVVHDGVSSFLIDLRTGERHPFPEDVAGPTHFAPDGTRVRLEFARDRVVVDRPGVATTGFDLRLPDPPQDVAWTPDGSVVAVIAALDTSGTVDVVDVEAAGVVHRLEPDVGGPYAVAFSPDGQRLAVSGQAERTEIYDVTSATVVGTLDRAANVAYSPDGRLLATNAFNGTIAFYDARTLEPAGEPLTGATAYASEMIFTADGRALVTSGRDNTLRFWDVATREQLGPAIAALDLGFAVAPEGAEVAATTHNGVQRYTLDRAALRDAACRIAGRELTVAEWERHIGGTRRDLCPARPPPS
jgi:WD40 repeat protein